MKEVAFEAEIWNAWSPVNWGGGGGGQLVICALFVLLLTVSKISAMQFNENFPLNVLNKINLVF